jgi:hypothetical protein
MGTHETEQKRKAVWSRRGLVISSHNGLNVLKFAPHFNSWPKLVRRLENHGYPCEVNLVGKNLVVSTTAELQVIQMLLENRRVKNKPKLRMTLLTPVLVVLGALSFTLQPQTFSTQSKAQLITEDKCGIEDLSHAIVADSPNPNILDRTSSRLGGIESGTFVCEDKSFSYTLELTKPKRVINLLKLNP